MIVHNSTINSGFGMGFADSLSSPSLINVLRGVDVMVERRLWACFRGALVAAVQASGDREEQ